ncbi:MAG TPA: heavy metal translocating P-type ATPase, partial [Steroidobacteraceae bacterium]|nr:heavy metal translocating P-type ATPase [Steroidobacteraceae bacterium]
ARAIPARTIAERAPSDSQRSSNSPCFHCGEPLLGSTLQANVSGAKKPVCCAGCLAVAELIANAGLSDFYQYREGTSVRPDAKTFADDPWAAYAQLDLAHQFTSKEEGTTCSYLLIENLRCAACAWLIEQTVSKIPGVMRVEVNAASGHARVMWNGSAMLLPEVLRTVARLGYRPHPLSSSASADAQRTESRSAMKRLLVAAFGMMQVMMFAVATYSATLNHESIDPALADFFRIVSLLVATPVMFYAGAPLFRSAWNSVRARFIGMDVPVVLALLLAYGASVWNALVSGRGEVYFDSVTMFVFFLTLSRFIHVQAQRRTVTVTDALAKQMPTLAHRIGNRGVEDISVKSLSPGDVILVRAGEVVPADGEIVRGASHFDESLLTGESIPLTRDVGQRVTAGTINLQNPIEVSVRSIGADTALSHVVNLLRRAQSQKPSISKKADLAAARFLRYVLIGAAVTCAVWLAIDPSRAFDATLAVLVVVCPCAFAIAMPAALAASTSNLADHGLLVTRPDALEALAKVDHLVFDKTGTLTHGKLEIARCATFASVSELECLQIAAALEQASEHPLARAFSQWTDARQPTSITTMAGVGVEGVLDGRRFRIGKSDYVAALRGSKLTDSSIAELSGTVIALGDERELLATFELTDAVRADAARTVQALRDMHIACHVVSGDGREAVVSVAHIAGIPECAARRTPEQKLAYIQNLQRQGHCVAMVGDGVNDAPVLGAADISIAMGRGAALSHASADMVLVSENLAAIPHAIRLARRTLAIARQNLRWSAAYNFAALPLAALGLVPPWLAAIGMSASSIAVVLNSMRLMPRARGGRPDAASRSGTALRPALNEG